MRQSRTLFGPVWPVFQRELVQFLLALTVVLTLLVLCVWTTYDSWHSTRRQALQLENNIVLAIEGQITQMITALDHSLQAAVDGMATPGLTEMDPRVRQAILFNDIGGINAAEGVIIADATGQVIYNWLDSERLKVNVSERPQFRAHRENASLGLIFSPPMQSLTDGRWIIGFSRRINRPDGSFAGVALGRISLDFMEKVLNRLDVGAAGNITLITSEGRLVARNPPLPSGPGLDVSEGLVFKNLRSDPSGVIEGRASFDSVERIYTYRRLPGLPFVIIVGLSKSELFKDWAVKSALLCLVMGVLLFIKISAALILRRNALQKAVYTKARLETLSRNLAKNRDEAMQANQAKSRFLTGVTHELRTPLNGILGYAQLLNMEGGLTSTQQHRVNAMRSAGEHLLGMINGVLDLSQIDSDCIELQATAVDIRFLVRACLDLVASAAQAKQLDLSMSDSPQVPARLGTDPTRLRQVLINLLGNAVKFTMAGSVQVRLLPGHVPGRVRIEVADSGPGVSTGQRDRLFKEFERLDSETRMTEGAGLGLAISSRLVERMGGEIGYCDNPEGGSVFWAEFPQAGVGAVAANDIVTDTTPPEGAAGLRVLVVDDVAMNTEIATAFLEHAGHDVRSVDNGEAAIEAVPVHDFDVVLMDVRMPGMDGLEATRLIRALPSERARVPIVAMTAQAFADQIDKCRAAGMDGHVAKPFQHDTLLKAIADAVSPRRKPAAPIAPPPGFSTASPPIMDEQTFRATAAYLEPKDLEKHLEFLIDKGLALSKRLCAPDIAAHAADLAEAAHALGGAAGAFGLRRIAEASRQFERAALGDGLLIVNSAELLRGEIDRSITVLRRAGALTAPVS